MRMPAGLYVHAKYMYKYVCVWKRNNRLCTARMYDGNNQQTSVLTLALKISLHQIFELRVL